MEYINGNRILFVFAGPSCSGKSYISEQVEKDFQFHRLPIITTRKPRRQENILDIKIYVSPKQFSLMRNRGDFVFAHKIHGDKYAAKKEDLKSMCHKDMVTTLTLKSIGEYKSNINICLIYLVPKSLWWSFHKNIHERSIKITINMIYESLISKWIIKRNIEIIDYVIKNDYSFHTLETVENIINREITKRDKMA